MGAVVVMVWVVESEVLRMETLDEIASSTSLMCSIIFVALCGSSLGSGEEAPGGTISLRGVSLIGQEGMV